MAADAKQKSTRGAVFIYSALALAVLYALGSGGSRKAEERSTASAARALDFDTEVRGLQSDLGGCLSGRVTPAQYGMGRLYGCISGQEETAKLFVNEDPDQTGQVLNVKMMWNEWKAHMPDAGADQREASRMARAVMKRYAPALEEDVLFAYWGKEAKSFSADGLRFDYRWTPGPGIDEHLLTVTPER